jgi:vanillate O-demethylase ferredoxin subunit
VQVSVDDEPATRRLNLPELLASVPDDAHVYCCGPEGMLSAYRNHGAALGTRLHFEYFSADTEASKAGDYRLELKRTGKTVEVRRGERMLDALLNAGVNVSFACSEGICGTCRVPVLDGIPDHRDHFLTQQEQDENAAVMVCCSGARTPTLVLDL